MNEKIASSFRDPSGFLFRKDGVLYRQINTAYGENYDHAMNVGLYAALVSDGLLIPHEEVRMDGADPATAYKIIRPELIPFISYPYEWCFSQLKNAALATLEIQKKSLTFGMSLKDCSAYNMQFRKGRPVLIDTLSFEKYREGYPWVAYKQFCQHFLAPLALMSYKDVRLNQLLRVYIDGISLDLASALLPIRTRFEFSMLAHIHLHAKAQSHFADKVVRKEGGQVSNLSFRGLIDSLESVIRKLKWKAQGTEWGDYYDDNNYSAEALEHKKQLVSNFLDKVSPKKVWDLGANDGMFSRIAADKGIQTVSCDVDPAAVEKNYLQSIARGDANILPLLVDLTNPSPGIGWANIERMSLLERGPTDTILALALMHHLAISNNVPICMIVDFFKKICSTLIIEFVPKEDSQVQRLLSTREDVFPDYDQRHFEFEFGKSFNIQDSMKIKDSVRTLYLLRKK